MTNHLLLIGIDKYLFHKPLNNCVKDLKDFKNLLLEKYDFEEQNVHELYDQNATSTYIQGALRSYGLKLTLDDNLIVYFSGHGHYDSTLDRAFWIPAEATNNYTTWIPNEVLITLIDRISCKHIFIISDSCFSNELLVPYPTKTIGEYFNRKSRWALTSAFQEAYDSKPGENSPFAAAVLQFFQEAKKEFRIGELIEFVKRLFEANKLQTPQGSPLYCKGHSAGEFIFDLKRPDDPRSFKGYNQFVKTLKLYKRNSQFHELGTFEDAASKIGFQIYQDVDLVVRKVTYYLYLYQGISLNKTFDAIVKSYPQIFKDKNLIIFLSKEKKQDNLPSRLQTVTEKFKPLNAFYIDDFIREQCTPQISTDTSTKYLNISNFVIPSFSNGLQAKDVKKSIEDWFAASEMPILVLKGTGGIGKTTFAQFVSDAWTSRSPQTSVMFIDSAQIKDILIRANAHSEGINIYDFYDAFWQIGGHNTDRLPEDLFSVNIDAGNILLVIDGLDEVISKVPNFNVDVFLNSINTSSRGIGNGKVVIACRTQFWEKSETESINGKIIELEAFDIEQARLFFEMSLDSKNKVKKALAMADQFKHPGFDTSNVFHPYVLDIIRSIINLGAEASEIDMSEFSSRQLRRYLHNDYIIYRVCDRERKRIGQISVDDQVSFFIYLATEKRGLAKQKNFRDFVEESLNRKVNATSATALLSHPFLHSSSDGIMFKYDFLADMFKGMYVSSYLDFENDHPPLSDEFINVVEENCWYGSATNTDIVNRMQHWSEYDILQMSEYVDLINASNSLSIEKKGKIVGNLFGLAVAINQRFSGNDIAANTALLKDMFDHDQGRITGLAIIGIGVEENIRFDLSNVTFENCYFNGYGSFWDCKFNASTRFNSCYLLNLRARTDRQLLSKSNFVDCIFDQGVEESLAKFEETASSKIERTKSFLNNFFHLFFSGGKLGRQWEHKIIQPRFGGISQGRFNYVNTIATMRSLRVILVSKELNRNKFYINEEFNEDIIRFIKDGTLSPLIVRLVKVFLDF